MLINILLVVYALVAVIFMIAMAIEAPKHGARFSFINFVVALIWPGWAIWYLWLLVADWNYTRKNRHV